MFSQEPIRLGEMQVELVHTCGTVMTLIVEGTGPSDLKYRTWAHCKPCRALALIRIGKWDDPRQLTDLELFPPVGPVQ